MASRCATNSGAINVPTTAPSAAIHRADRRRRLNVTNAGAGISQRHRQRNDLLAGDGIRIRGGAANDGTSTVNYTGNITTFGGNSDGIDVRTQLARQHQHHLVGRDHRQRQRHRRHQRRRQRHHRSNGRSTSPPTSQQLRRHWRHHRRRRRDHHAGRRRNHRSAGDRHGRPRGVRAGQPSTSVRTTATVDAFIGGVTAPTSAVTARQGVDIVIGNNPTSPAACTAGVFSLLAATSTSPAAWLPARSTAAWSASRRSRAAMSTSM